MPVIIRDAQPSDIVELAQFAETMFRETFAYIPYDEQFLNEHMDDAFSESYFTNSLDTTMLLVAYQGDALAGYAQSGPLKLPVETPQVPNEELYRLYITPSLQGQGLAQQMMDEFMQRTKDKTLYLGVYSENYKAQSFYTRYGFTKIGEYGYRVGEHIDREWMMMREKD